MVIPAQPDPERMTRSGSSDTGCVPPVCQKFLIASDTYSTDGRSVGILCCSEFSCDLERKMWAGKQLLHLGLFQFQPSTNLWLIAASSWGHIVKSMWQTFDVCTTSSSVAFPGKRQKSREERSLPSQINAFWFWMNPENGLRFGLQTLRARARRLFNGWRELLHF